MKKHTCHGNLLAKTLFFLVTGMIILFSSETRSYAGWCSATNVSDPCAAAGTPCTTCIAGGCFYDSAGPGRQCNSTTNLGFGDCYACLGPADGCVFDSACTCSCGGAVCSAAPSAPSIVSPTVSPEQTFGTTPPSFDWNDVDWKANCNTKTYTVFLRKISPSFDPATGYSTNCTTTNVSTCSFTYPIGYTNNSRYEWFVRATNEFGSADSPLGTFRTCWNSAPAAPTLVSPANPPVPNLLTGAQPPVTVRWSHSNSWGVGCPSNINSFTLYVKAKGAAASCSAIADMTVGAAHASSHLPTATQFTINSGLALNTTYCWMVRALNGSSFSDSPRWEFTTPIGSVTGKVWRVSGNSCAVAHDPGISGFTIEANGVAGSATGSSGNYVINNVPATISGPDQVCARPPLPAPSGTGFSSYKLKCGKGFTYGTNISGNCLILNAPNHLRASSTSIDLGFAPESGGWFQSILGDVYSRGGIVQGMPSSLTYHTAVPYMIDKPDNHRDFSDGLAMSPGSITVQEFSLTPRVSNGTTVSNQNYQLANSSTLVFPEAINFTRTGTAISNCSTFFNSSIATGVYSTTEACFESALAGGAASINYNSTGTGSIVIYITTEAADLVINKQIRPSALTQAPMVLVVNGKVTFPSTLRNSTVLSETQAAQFANTIVGVSIIARDGIDFPCSGSPCDGLDGMIVTRGSLITKGNGTGLAFLRNRENSVPGGNDYPTAVVNFDPRLLINLNSLEESGVSTGLHTFDVIWRSVQ